MDGANDDRELAPDIGSPLPTRHSSLSIALHWATAVLALLLVSTGLTMSRLPGADPQRLWYTRFHLFTGLIMGAVVLTRLFSLISREPLEPLPLPRWRRALSGVVRAATYATLVTMVISGFCVLAMTNFGPWLLGDEDAALPDFAGVVARPVHGAFSKVLIGLVVAHVIGVAVQHFRTRNVLQRMGL